MWKEIASQTGIDYLMELYGSFENTCLRDVHISTREFVAADLLMSVSNTPTAMLLFQRQSESNAVLELEFEHIGRFNYMSFDDVEWAIISGASIVQANGLFYWADFPDWKIGDNNAIWISGKRLFWRMRPDLMGNVRRVDGK